MTVTTSKSQPAGSNPGNPALTEKEAGQLGYAKEGLLHDGVTGWGHAA